MARLTCYDGVGCIGGDKILLEDGDTKLWLDFGMNYSQWGKFYEEYLKPKACMGLYEPIQMGFVPPVCDLYRSDLVSSLALDLTAVGGGKTLSSVALRGDNEEYLGTIPVGIEGSKVTIGLTQQGAGYTPGHNLARNGVDLTAISCPAEDCK